MAKFKKRKLQEKAKGPPKRPGSAPVKKVTQPQAASKPQQQQRPTIPFQAEDRILLVGEGDFSFAKSIVEEHACCDVTATCLDTQDVLFEKYQPQAEEHVRYLEEEGQTVLYGIDATTLDQSKQLKKLAGGLYDVIMFNFPHVGGKSKDVNRQVRFNQELLVKFFSAAATLLANGGTIVVTLFEGEPYTLWNIRDLARFSNLEVQRSFKFQADAYPGYSHARTLGNIDGGGGWKGEDRNARSYVFQKKGGAVAGKQDSQKQKQTQKQDQPSQAQPEATGTKRKRGKGEDSSDEEGG